MNNMNNKRIRESDNSSSSSSSSPSKIRKVVDGSLSEEQQFIAEKFLQGHSIVLTGAAGTGKTTLVRSIIEALKRTRLKVYITASTGLAAVALKGRTLHSFAGFGLIDRNSDVDELVKKAKPGSATFQRWVEVDVLIVDEISMIDAELIDILEQCARKIRKNELPFGGIQLLFAGHFLQLGPVNKFNITPKKQLAFAARCWNQCFKYEFHLSQIFRQQNIQFGAILNHISLGNITDSIKDFFRPCIHRKFDITDGILPTKLYAKRCDVGEENQIQLNLLKGKSFIYNAKDYGAKYFTDMFQRDEPAPNQLELKIGAQVILLKNLETDKQLFNGSRGVVIGFRKATLDDFRFAAQKKSALEDPELEYPIVRFINKEEIIMLPCEWSIEEAGKVVAARLQIPLNLAWALTIHKAQGMTLDRCILDLSGIFDPGQGYTALSRTKDLESLSLLSEPPWNKIIADPSAVGYYAHRVITTMVSLEESFNAQWFIDNNEEIEKILKEANQYISSASLRIAFRSWDPYSSLYTFTIPQVLESKKDEIIETLNSNFFPFQSITKDNIYLSIKIF